VSFNNKLFYWHGLNIHGDFLTGEIFAKSINDVENTLKSQKIIIRSIVQKNVYISRFSVKKRDIVSLTRQIATTLTTHISFVKTLELVAVNQTNCYLKQVLHTIMQDMDAGLMFCEAIKKYPKIFGKLYCSLVRVGEESATLIIIFNKLAAFLENKEKVKKQAKKTLVYPVIVFFIAVIVVIGLLIFVVPEFEALFKSFDSELPIVTLLIVRFAKLCKLYIGYLFIFILTLLGISKYLYKSSIIFINMIDRMLLSLPIIGSLLQNVILSRLFISLNIAYGSGISLVESLKLVLDTISNTVYKRNLMSIIVKISEGEEFKAALCDVRLFPGIVVSMMGLGEKSGTLDIMLKHAAEYFEKSLEQHTSYLMSILEPIVMTTLGVIIGGLIFAMYLPMLKLGSVI
jgi:type IV pilus assembly protein PilC